MGFIEQQGNKLREEQFMANQLANYERGLAAEAERQAAVRQVLNPMYAAEASRVLNQGTPGLAGKYAPIEYNEGTSVKDQYILDSKKAASKQLTPDQIAIDNMIASNRASNARLNSGKYGDVPVGDLKEVFTNDIITITPEQFANSGAVSPEVKNRAQQTLKEYAKWQQGYK